MKIKLVNAITLIFILLFRVAWAPAALANTDVSNATELQNAVNGGCAKLETLTLGKLENIKEIYLAGTGIKALDCGGCGNLASLDLRADIELTSLNAKGCSLGFLDVSGCVKLSELDCSDNSLGWLNLEDLGALSDVNYSGQKIYGWIPGTRIKISDYIGSNDIGRVAEILAYGSGGTGIESRIEGNGAECYAVFGSVPEGAVYYYDTKFNGGELMDVTLADGSISSSGAQSGSGCETSRNEEAGSRKYLILALFALVFALLKRREIKKV